MKTLTTITVLIALAIMFSASLNDIPFNTTEIYNEIIAEQNLAEFNFEEEQYIDDIPFDTECITAQCKYQKAISIEFNFEEEQTIDDINL